MAAAGSIERGPSMVDQWGPYARSVSGPRRLAESAAIAESDRSESWARRPSVGEFGRCPRCVWASVVVAWKGELN
ncbi:hypothetical protein SAMN05428964_1012156 [Thalassospira xiamenensis]|uniref:Uncharacterized protein n=1 Tax=Thalassospira xiamenensis TaxID=220697 RepID=A0A285RTI9_9PROT|nr:hypothetical protein SAMN05428964_1012156 [Thalassospira xiamenensis]